MSKMLRKFGHAGSSPSFILSDSQVLRNLVISHARHLEIADFSTTFTYLLLFLLISSLDLSLE
ncbi:hypothetical protein HID58_092178 [Brassica napus]|uniref:Uncharacterized protein n=1 Tax=Brassica napus TaxID=3708 RepID=A0ABQ7WXC2_BRANA|nr:hypothetical protein HID58_092178 [Brassica napus]